MVSHRQFMQRSAAAAASTFLAPMMNGCGGGSDAPAYSATIAAMTPFIAQQMTDNQVTGMAIVLVDDQHTVWAQGFGYADLANLRPVTPDTLFEIGSTSKTFTGTLVMQLYERGLLDIDAPLTAAWSARVGHYELVDLDPNDAMRHMAAEVAAMVMSIDLKHQDGLMLLARGEETYVIAPVSNTLGYLRGLGRRQGGAIPIVNVGGEEQVQFLDYRYRMTA